MEEHKMIVRTTRERHFSNIYKSGKVTSPVSITQRLVYLLPDEKDSPFLVIGKIINKKNSKGFYTLKGIFDSRTIICEFMLSDTVPMENQTALRAAWLCGRASFLETRLKQQFRFQLDLSDDFRSTFEKKHVMT